MSFSVGSQTQSSSALGRPPRLCFPLGSGLSHQLADTSAVWIGSPRTVMGPSLCSSRQPGGGLAYRLELRSWLCCQAPCCSLCPRGSLQASQLPVHPGLIPTPEDARACLRGLLAGWTNAWKVLSAGPPCGGGGAQCSLVSYPGRLVFTAAP